ncbi:MAG: hypothetical protein RI897_789 [Verrucomicrobiota bacterium]
MVPRARRGGWQLGARSWGWLCCSVAGDANRSPISGIGFLQEPSSACDTDPDSDSDFDGAGGFSVRLCAGRGWCMGMASTDVCQC